MLLLGLRSSLPWNCSAAVAELVTGSENLIAAEPEAVHRRGWMTALAEVVEPLRTERVCRALGARKFDSCLLRKVHREPHRKEASQYHFADATNSPGLLHEEKVRTFFD